MCVCVLQVKWIFFYPTLVVVSIFSLPWPDSSLHNATAPRDCSRNSSGFLNCISRSNFLSAETTESRRDSYCKGPFYRVRATDGDVDDLGAESLRSSRNTVLPVRRQVYTGDVDRDASSRCLDICSQLSNITSFFFPGILFVETTQRR